MSKAVGDLFKCDLWYYYHSKLDNPVELHNITMYVLSFPGLFQLDDVSRITSNDIFNEGFMVMKVPKGENVQLCRGDEVGISELPSHACPVKLLKKYLTKFQIPPDSRDLIFRSISKGKDSRKLIAAISLLVTALWEKVSGGICRALGLTPPSLSGTLCPRVVQLWHLTVVSATEFFFNHTVAGSPCKPLAYMLMMIWIKDFLFPSSLDSESCKLLTPIYLAFAQYFVILYRRSSPGPPKINSFGSAMLCCYFLWSADKMYYFWWVS